MERMFGWASHFDKDIRNWDVNQVTNCTDFLKGSAGYNPNMKDDKGWHPDNHPKCTNCNIGTP